MCPIDCYTTVIFYQIELFEIGSCAAKTNRNFLQNGSFTFVVEFANYSFVYLY